MYDAVSIEYAFADLLGVPMGARGGLHDADTFRVGSTKDIGKLLQNAADVMQTRVDRIPFEDWEKENGQPKTRINFGIQRIREIGQQMEKEGTPEPNDYHWVLIGGFVQFIAAFLNHMEGKKAH